MIFLFTFTRIKVLDGRGVRFSAGTGNFSLRHHVQTGSGAHPASYSIGIGSLFSRDKAPGV
jgi:hypothetical protein